MIRIGWSGVFPAATTQFAPDLSVDYAATQKVQDALIADGVHGLIVLGTCGENNSLEPDEKRTVLKGAVEASAAACRSSRACRSSPRPRAVRSRGTPRRSASTV